jgi:hypothetical protein
MNNDYLAVTALLARARIYRKALVLEEVPLAYLTFFISEEELRALERAAAKHGIPGISEERQSEGCSLVLGMRLALAPDWQLQ